MNAHASDVALCGEFFAVAVPNAADLTRGARCLHDDRPGREGNPDNEVKSTLERSVRLFTEPPFRVLLRLKYRASYAAGQRTLDVPPPRMQ